MNCGKIVKGKLTKKVLLVLIVLFTVFSVTPTSFARLFVPADINQKITNESDIILIGKVTDVTSKSIEKNLYPDSTSGYLYTRIPYNELKIDVLDVVKGNELVVDDTLTLSQVTGYFNVFEGYELDMEQDPPNYTYTEGETCVFCLVKSPYEENIGITGYIEQQTYWYKVVMQQDGRFAIYNNKSNVPSGYIDYDYVHEYYDSNNVLPIPTSTISPSNTPALTNVPTSTATTMLPTTTPKLIVDEFIDMPKEGGSVHWAADYVYDLAQKGVICGYKADSGEYEFKPDNFITRAEFMKILVNMYDIYEPDSTCNFTDVNEESWEYHYVASAYNEGLVQGMGNEIFDPSKFLTRAEFMTAFKRAFTKFSTLNDPVSDNEISSILDKFNDKNEIPDWAREAIALNTKLGFVNGYIENDTAFLKPNNNVTRAEVCKVISCAFK